MLEVNGNLWLAGTDALVITTNGFIKNDGTAVMGRGCAAEAKRRFTGVELRLGHLLSRFGNHVFFLGNYTIWETNTEARLYTFPTKHNWFENSDIALIEQSARELVTIIKDVPVKTVTLPQPGCGNGGLNWRDVKPAIEPILDDRFQVITW